MDNNMRILLLEDSYIDAELELNFLKKEFSNFEYKITDDKDDFVELLKHFKPTLILSDYFLPQFTGMDALEIVKKHDPNIPFIIVTGTLDEETAANCIKSGAWDYVLKENFARLAPAINNAIKTKENRIKFTETQKEKRRNEKLYQSLFDLSRDAIFLMKDNNIISINKATEKLFGLNQTNVNINKPDHLSPEFQPNGEKSSVLINYHINKTLKTGFDKFEWIHKTVDGKNFLAEISINRISIDNGPFIQAIIHDISKERETELELESIQELNNLIMENSPDSVVLSDLNGKVLFINESGMKKMELEDIIDLNWLEMWKGPLKNDIKVYFDQAIQGNRINFRGNYPTTKTSSLWFDVILTPIKNKSGKIDRILSIARDITKQVTAEIKLKESESYFRMLHEKSPAGYQSLNENGYIIDVNDSWLEMLNYTRDEVIGKWFGNFLTDEMKQHFEKSFSKFKEKGEIKNVEFDMVSKDKQNSTVSFNGKISRDEKGRFIATHSVLTDITSRKRQEEITKQNQKNLENILDSMPFAVILVSTDKRIIHANKTAIDMSGYKNLKDIKERSCNHILCPTLNGLCPILDDHQIIDRSERILVHKNGSLIPILKSALMIKYDNKDTVLESFVDISELKNAENKIKKSLKEKDVLLKEVHHRVKNNMQIISSLLNLQSRKIEDENLLSHFRDSQNRVKSMALIHEKLYKTSDFTEIDFSSYILSLTQNLTDSYDIEPDRITLELKLNDVKLDINLAIPCGLIINELISNIYKHAFPNSRKGKITIKLDEKNNKRSLSISDNGIGLPDDFQIKQQQSLGFKLIQSLVYQLHGKLEINTDKITEFILIF